MVKRSGAFPVIDRVGEALSEDEAGSMPLDEACDAGASVPAFESRVFLGFRSRKNPVLVTDETWHSRMMRTSYRGGP